MVHKPCFFMSSWSIPALYAVVAPFLLRLWRSKKHVQPQLVQHDSQGSGQHDCCTRYMRKSQSQVMHGTLKPSLLGACLNESISPFSCLEYGTVSLCRISYLPWSPSVYLMTATIALSTSRLQIGCCSSSTLGGN